VAHHGETLDALFQPPGRGVGGDVLVAAPPSIA